MNNETHSEHENKTGFEATTELVILRHGAWKINCDGYYPYCSECYTEPRGRHMTNYCPECGAKMDK